MKGKKKKKLLGWIQYEIFLVLLIIICTSYMNVYENIFDRYTAMSVSPAGKLAVLHNKENAEIFRNYGWPIIEFNHDSTEFVIMFNENQEEIYQLMLGDVIPLNGALYSMEDWWGIFQNNPDGGKIHLKDANINMIIHYEWLHFDNNITYLLIYNTNIRIDNLVTVFNIISYATIIIAFILLISIIYHKYHKLAKDYHESNMKIKEIISK